MPERPFACFAQKVPDTFSPIFPEYEIGCGRTAVPYRWGGARTLTERSEHVKANRVLKACASIGAKVCSWAIDKKTLKSDNWINSRNPSERVGPPLLDGT